MSLVYQNLVGRAFVAGSQDCFGLVRDFFRTNFDIAIRDYARPTDWSSDAVDLMRLAHEREGFVQITDWRASDLRPADVLCMAIGDTNPNHFAIYVGDNTIVHHLFNRISNAEPYRDFWRNITGYLLRHPLVPDLRPVHPDVDIRTLLRDRYQVEA